MAGIVGAAGPVAAAEVEPGMEERLLELSNAARASKGLAPVSMSANARAVARDWSLRMSSTGELAHREQLSGPFTGSWDGLAENVAYAGDLASVHEAFLGSSAHRDNLFGAHEWVGVGVAVDGSGRVWATVILGSGDDTVEDRFRAPATASTAEPVHGFVDVRTDDAFADDVAWIVDSDIAAGCTADRFCPTASLTRGQLAELVSRAFSLPAAGSSGFHDVDVDHPFDAAIASLTEVGIAAGCGDDRFCPDAPVTRAQTAAFLARAAELPHGDADFADVGPGHRFADEVAALADAEVTVGCGNDRFCPDVTVTRAQFAALLARTLD